MNHILFDHLVKDSYWTLFSPVEFNNALRFLYTTIASAVRDSADSIQIRRTNIRWHREGIQIGEFGGEEQSAPDPSYWENMKLMLERDQIVREYLIVSQENENEITLAIRS